MNVKLLSWDETAATVREELLRRFPNFDNLYVIGKGTLCILKHPKPAYQLGFVFPLQEIASKAPGTIVYYPVKNSFVYMPKALGGAPVSQTTAFEPTKRGNMQIVELGNGDFGVSFVLIH